MTSTASRRPIVSMTMLRFRPTILLPASMPWLEAGTLVERQGQRLTGEESNFLHPSHLSTQAGLAVTSTPYVQGRRSPRAHELPQALASLHAA
ncbi:hypothetical protein ACFV2U_24705 [Streptomyces sp. NPDC059697]|uniref:hypothetical protein n=1 Tax=Streptomyces sp. NPDC059697 TaxID=3346912 RepID=UPI0036D0D954